MNPTISTVKNQTPPLLRSRAFSKGIEGVLATVPEIRVAAVAVRVRVLPDALVGPATGDSTNGARILSQHQRVICAEGSAAAGTGVPPVSGGVDHGIATRLAVVGLAEVLDPCNHIGFAQPVAGRTGWVILDIEHAGQGLAIGGPATPVGKEELGLGCTGTGVRVSKMITTPNKTGIGCTLVMAGEGAVDIGRALRGLGMISVSIEVSIEVSIGVSIGVSIEVCERSVEAYLDYDESSAGIIGTGEVHGTLVAGDIKALNPTGAGLQGIGARGTGHKNE